MRGLTIAENLVASPSAPNSRPLNQPRRFSWPYRAPGATLRTVRHLILYLALGILPSCAVFAPRYDADLDAQAETAYLGVQRLLAGIHIGEFADRTSFLDARSRYADVIASLALAEQRAKSLPVSGRGTGNRARDNLAALFADCRAQIVSMASIHRRVGLTSALGVSAPVSTSCDAAARAARALK